MTSHLEEQIEKLTNAQLIEKSQCEIYHCEWDNVHGDIVLFV